MSASLKKFFKPNLGTKLLIFFLTMSLVPLIALMFFAYQNVIRSLGAMTKQNLEAVTVSKAKRIEGYVIGKEKSALFLAKMPAVKNAALEFREAFLHGGIDGIRYKKTDSKFRTSLVVFEQEMDFDDLFLVTSEGDAVFSIRRGEDFGSNYFTGVYHDSELALALEKAKKTQEVTLSSFAYYQATNEPAAFIVAPIVNRGQVIGMVAAQLKNDEFYSVINEIDGLGQTGETILASRADGNALFLSPIRFDHDAAFRTRIPLGSSKFPAIQQVVLGQNGYGPSIDYRGHPVIASWCFLHSLNWGLLVKIDTAEAYALIAKQRILVLILTSLTVIGVFVGAYFVARSISRPIVLLTKTVAAFTEGHLDQSIEVMSEDEIGELSGSFNKMAENLRGLLSVIRMKNDELTYMNFNLERVVEERTATIRTILDNVQSGFFLIGPDQKVQEGYTKSCETLFDGHLSFGQPIVQCLGLNERDAGNFKVQVDQVFEDIMEVSHSLSQIPHRFVMAGKVLHFAGSVIRNQDKKIEAILFTVVDETDLERAESESRTNKALVRLIQKKGAFRSFMQEMRTGINASREAVKQKSDFTVRYNLHTLKGNMSAFGLVDIAAFIHQVEDHIQIGLGDINAVEDQFRSFLKLYYPILGLDYDAVQGDDTYRINSRSLEALESVMQSSGSLNDARAGTLRWVYEVKLKRGVELLGPIPEYAEKLAERMGKRLEVQVENGDILLDPAIASPVIQVLPHLVRNSVDHGIEIPSERGTKPKIGILKIVFKETNETWGIAVIDNGRGLDLEKIVQKAIGNGFIKSGDVSRMSESEKCRLVFLGGVSSSDSISEVSGRGIGMSAVIQSIETGGGKVKVESVKGEGTTIEVVMSKVA